MNNDANPFAEIVKVSRLPTAVITATPSIDTTEEATVYVSDHLRYRPALGHTSDAIS